MINTHAQLSHRDAFRILEFLSAELEAGKLGACVAVTDPHGELIALLRTDGCPLPSINNAINKAYTAARERMPSYDLGQASRNDGFPMTNFGDLRYTAWGGGVPIKVKGEVVGAVGVSGLPEKEDMVLAEKAAGLFAA